MSSWGVAAGVAQPDVKPSIMGCKRLAPLHPIADPTEGGVHDPMLEEDHLLGVCGQGLLEDGKQLPASNPMTCSAGNPVQHPWSRGGRHQSPSAEEAHYRSTPHSSHRPLTLARYALHGEDVSILCGDNVTLQRVPCL